MPANIHAQFSNMLKEYDKTGIIHNSLMNYDYFLNAIKKDPNWLDGSYSVKFVGAEPITAVKGYALPEIDDIQSWEYVKGYIEDQVPFNGSIVFYERDIQRHEKKATRSQTYLTSFLVSQIKGLVARMRSQISLSMLNGYVAKATSTGTNTGVVKVSNIEIFSLKDRYVFRDDSTPSAKVGYIQKIDLSTDEITVSEDPDGLTPLDFTALGAGFDATNGTIYVYGDVDIATGALQNRFVNIRDALLSATNGGSPTLHGIVKTDYPFLQAINVDGSSITASNIIRELFKAFTLEIARKSKQGNKGMAGTPNTVLVGRKLFASIAMKAYEDVAGYYVEEGKKKTFYPYEVITLGSYKGISLKLVEVPELDNDVILFLNPNTFTFASLGKLGQRGNLDGSGKKMTYIRSTTKEHLYVYDVGIDANLAVENPQANGIIYNVPTITL